MRFSRKKAKSRVLLKKAYLLLIFNNKINDKYKNKFEILSKELEEKDNHISKLLMQVKAKDETIKYYCSTNEETVNAQSYYKNEMDKLKEYNSKLDQKVKELQAKLDEFFVNKKSENALQLEIEHLKRDNTKLLQMLKTTHEYKDFADLAQNTKGGVKYLPNNNNNNGNSNNSSNTTYKPLAKSNIKLNHKNPKQIIETGTSEDKWVPKEVSLYML